MGPSRVASSIHSHVDKIDMSENLGKPIVQDFVQNARQILKDQELWQLPSGNLT